MRFGVLGGRGREGGGGRGGRSGAGAFFGPFNPAGNRCHTRNGLLTGLSKRGFPSRELAGPKPNPRILRCWENVAMCEVFFF